MKRIERARLVMALVAGPHTVGSLGNYAARNATPAEILGVLEALESGGFIRSAEERSRTGRAMRVYRWSSR
ncbi:hypothetical protein [Singulisphaera sp. PoT]|uniref:hypothetical protein n=1 Tax=Singulisphaera sp. PoT TaxID=3411797 RepID=UPI003BF5DBFD